MNIFAKFQKKNIAIIVPCWQEHEVIEAMLKHNISNIDYHHYDIFVGTYPNDEKTIAAVKNAMHFNNKIHCVVGPKFGPTNKADNLNSIYQYLCQYEQEYDKFYDIVVFHDSEDLIHHLSLKLYNALIPKNDMVQIPIYPLPVSLLKFTHWLYADEFSEYHTKDLTVREKLIQFVPSAGVGTGFARTTIECLKNLHEGCPFPNNSLTEDYSLSLKIHLQGLKQIFVTEAIQSQKWRKRWYLFGEYIPIKIKERVATRALFPMNYFQSVKQKSRWILGIALQEWEISGWPGSWLTRYILFHDRKALVGHLVNGLGYIIFIFWLVYSSLTFERPYYPSLQEQFDHYPMVLWLMNFCIFLMLLRISQRIISVYRIYGLAPALLTLPRGIYGNLLNLNALLRAYIVFFFNYRRKTKPKWDKTEHEFPIKNYFATKQKRLTDLLIEKNLLAQEQMIVCLNEHFSTGEPLTNIFLSKNIIDKATLNQIIAESYQLNLLSEKQYQERITLAELPVQLIRHYYWLKRNNCDIYRIDLKNKIISVIISEPSNSSLMNEITKKFRYFSIHYYYY